MTRRNRKKEFYNHSLIINNEHIEINSTETLGVYPIIIEKMVEQLDICLAIHKRVFVLRFDLHLKEYSGDNKIISTFMNRLKQWIKRNYKTKNIGSIWARELERAKTQHYHCAFFIDGDVLQYPSKLLQQIKAKWFKNRHCQKPDNCFYYIEKKNLEEERAKAIYRLSYLAKTRGKGHRNPQAKDYQTSRLKLNL
jgi:hypothetical protein